MIFDGNGEPQGARTLIVFVSILISLINTKPAACARDASAIDVANNTLISNDSCTTATRAIAYADRVFDNDAASFIAASARHTLSAAHRAHHRPRTRRRLKTSVELFHFKLIQL
jgi:hypothetical protein